MNTSRLAFTTRPAGCCKQDRAPPASTHLGSAIACGGRVQGSGRMVSRSGSAYTLSAGSVPETLAGQLASCAAEQAHPEWQKSGHCAFG